MSRILCFLAMPFLVDTAVAANIEVSSSKELVSAIGAAQPGDTLTLAPGRYVTTKFRIRAGGTKDRPITLRAETLGTVRIESEDAVAFDVNAAYWHFENLDVVGQCNFKNHSNCEHAFHIFGDADGIEIRSSRLVDFNAAIKANGRPSGADRHFPDDVVIRDSFIYNTSARNTRNPVTAIDVVGGRRWHIIDNFMADYGRVDGIASYHGFLKGHSTDGLIARNLAVCNWRHEGQGRVGLSLGGGGVSDASAEVCEDKLCKVEHSGGQIIGNIVARCSSEPGLYLNAAENTRVSGNLLFHTTGIQLHTQYASAEIAGNILNGGVRGREGSQHTAKNNEIYGTLYGAFLPAVSAYVVRRLEGQAKKYPSFITPGMESAVQSFVQWVFSVASRTPLGLGTGAMSDIVADADGLNFTLEDPQVFSQEGLTFAAGDTDFCGRLRGADSTAGPFVAADPPCDVSERIRRVLDLERMSPVM